MLTATSFESSSEALAKKHYLSSLDRPAGDREGVCRHGLRLVR